MGYFPSSLPQARPSKPSTVEDFFQISHVPFVYFSNFPPSLAPFLFSQSMWHSSSSRFLFRALIHSAAVNLPTRLPAEHRIRPWAHHLCSTTTFPPTSGASDSSSSSDSMSFNEAKRLMRLVNVEALKRKLGMENEEVIGYKELLEACEGMGVARTKEEAVAFAKVLDDAGVVLLFRDKVYLHPDKVVDLVRRAVPLALTPENDPRREELKELRKKKEEIDMLAHKQVRHILWSGLGFFIIQGGLFFRLTFWEFSWDVMEPIAFFTTAAGILVGYAYFLFTSRDPTYQDLMKRLFISRQRKLCQKKSFDMERFKELQKHCKCPLEGKSEVDAIHAIHKD